jgi:hypothetical protein
MEEAARSPGKEAMPPSDDEIETPADRAERTGEEELGLHRWTDAELRKRAEELGISKADSLSRLELIERLEKAS